jgi:hypothetical protein
VTFTKFEVECDHDKVKITGSPEDPKNVEILWSGGCSRYVKPLDANGEPILDGPDMFKLYTQHRVVKIEFTMDDTIGGSGVSLNYKLIDSKDINNGEHGGGVSILPPPVGPNGKKCSGNGASGRPWDVDGNCICRSRTEAESCSAVTHYPSSFACGGSYSLCDYLYGPVVKQDDDGIDVRDSSNQPRDTSKVFVVADYGNDGSFGTLGATIDTTGEGKTYTDASTGKKIQKHGAVHQSKTSSNNLSCFVNSAKWHIKPSMP